MIAYQELLLSACSHGDVQILEMFMTVLINTVGGGDTYPVEPGDKIGSKLWQLLRRKLTDDVIAEVEELSRDSLQWMIDDGICSNVDVSVERSEINRVNISVVLTVDGKQTSYKFKEV